MSSAKSTSKPAQVVGLFPALSGFGGIQEASRQTLHALRNILAPRKVFGAYLGLNDPLGSQIVQAEAQVQAKDDTIAFTGYQRSKLRFVLQALRLARKKPLIVIAAHVNLAVVAQWMKRISPRTKTIVLCHGVEVWDSLPANRRRALLAADIILCPSTYTASKVNTIQGVSRDKIRILPWPINSEVLRMAQAKSNLAPPPGFPQGPVILTVGRWASAERYKGADDLIRAMPQLRASFPGLSLVAVGGGDDLPRLKAIAAELQIADCVHFLQGISREQLAACYAHSEIFALPSTGEGFGIVFIEAMAFGLPVVGVAAGGLTDIIRDGANGFLVPAKDPGALADSLARLLSDPSLWSEMGRNGAETINQRYRFPLFEKSLQQILLECGLDSVSST
jgi:phosphatidylinositol alpha-1,6-mannosyltransferase